MGYYASRQTNRRPKRNRSWLYGLIGIIVGAAAIYLFYVNTGDQGNAVHHNGNNQTSPTETIEGTQVSVDVSTQITDIVDGVSAAVVGVTNIQKRSDFWMEEEASEAGTGSGVIYKKDKE